MYQWDRKRIISEANRARAKAHFTFCPLRTLTECKKLLHMIQLSKDRGYIDSGTFDYWTKLTVDVKCMTARWYDAERKTGIPVEPAGPIPEG